ncbi:MAG TPA: hypothetical protein VFV50_06995 [Bdellovibrionales bacterium]|nr:hypothetical protein [Bdellovibrionales bacterium]
MKKIIFYLTAAVVMSLKAQAGFAASSVSCDFTSVGVQAPFSGRFELLHNVNYKLRLQLQAPAAQNLYYESLDLAVYYRAEILKLIDTDPVYKYFAGAVRVDKTKLAAAEVYTAYPREAAPPHFNLIRFVDVDGRELGKAGLLKLQPFVCK